MRYFCTVSDKNYLSKGIALYDSLNSANREFILFYLCLDDITYNFLEKKNYTGLMPYNLKHIKAPPKNKFSNHTDFCYSMASYFTNWLMENVPRESIAYLDSDLYFYQDYECIFDEIKNKSIGIIEHRIPTYANVGKYNVGIVYFRNDRYGNKCLKRWRDLLLNPDNKYVPEYGNCGDQKYLELFPKWYKSKVHIINCGHGAWWNNRFYRFDKQDIIWNGKRQKLIFMHYSKFELNGTTYKHNEMTAMPNELKEYYDHYYKIIKDNESMLRNDSV